MFRNNFWFEKSIKCFTKISNFIEDQLNVCWEQSFYLFNIKLYLNNENDTHSLLIDIS